MLLLRINCCCPNAHQNIVQSSIGSLTTHNNINNIKKKNTKANVCQFNYIFVLKAFLIKIAFELNNLHFNSIFVGFFFLFFFMVLPSNKINKNISPCHPTKTTTLTSLPKKNTNDYVLNRHEKLALATITTFHHLIRHKPYTCNTQNKQKP